MNSSHFLCVHCQATVQKHGVTWCLSLRRVNLQVRNNRPLAIKKNNSRELFTHTSSYHKLMLYEETISCYRTHLSAIYDLMSQPAAAEPLDLQSVNKYCAKMVWLILIDRIVHSVALSKKMIQRWHILPPQSIKAVWQGDNKPFSQTQVFVIVMGLLDFKSKDQELKFGKEAANTSVWEWVRSQNPGLSHCNLFFFFLYKFSHLSLWVGCKMVSV